MRYSCLLIISAAALLAGCASDLEIFADKDGLMPGVPFHTPELYVRHGVYTKASKGGACDQKTPFVEVEALPLGPLYYASIKPAQFAKTGFVMKFNDKGSLSEITLNTEPSSGEALKSAGELIKAVTPILGVGAPGGEPAGSLPACDTGPVGVEYTRFSDWPPKNP
jgi:hypothetical protein